MDHYHQYQEKTARPPDERVRVSVKYDFDSLFEGSDEEQMERQTAFMEGLNAVIRKRREDFAHAVLAGHVSQRERYAEVAEAERARAQLLHDPRIEVLKQRVLGNALHEAVENVIRARK